MKKVKSYSAEFKIIPEGSSAVSEGPSVNFPKSRSSDNPQSAGGQQSEGASHQRRSACKKKLTKQNQEFINNISASGFKQFNMQSTSGI